MSVAGVVAALSVEARTLGSLTRRRDGLWSAHDGALVAVSGMGCTAAGLAARALIDSGAGGLVSWGMAGGLDPHLQAGSICVPSAVLSRDGARFPTAERWRNALMAAIGARCPVVGGELLTSVVAIGDVAGKAAAFRETGALAVDMESLAVAQVAVACEVPFVAVRVIVDTAGDALPPAVMAASRDGPVRISRLVLGVARSPLQFAAVLRLAHRYRTATRALVTVARSGALAPLACGAASRTRIA